MPSLIQVEQRKNKKKKNGAQLGVVALAFNSSVREVRQVALCDV